MLWWLALVRAEPLTAAVADLVAESRDFIVAEQDFATQATHDRFSRFCAENLHGNASAAARASLQRACEGEAVAWAQREEQCGREVSTLDSVLHLLGQAPDEPVLLQVSSVVSNSSAEAGLCLQDLQKLSALQRQLHGQVNATMRAVAVVGARLERDRAHVLAVKDGAHQTAQRVGRWSSDYASQQQHLQAESARHAATARAVGVCLELLQSFYAERDVADALALDVQQWEAELAKGWPHAPAFPPPYTVHKQVGEQLVAVLQVLARVMDEEAAGRRQVEAAVLGEATRVRRIRGDAARSARATLQELRRDVGEMDKALGALRDRLHSEQTQLQQVDDKVSELRSMCDKLGGPRRT